MTAPELIAHVSPIEFTIVGPTEDTEVLSADSAGTGTGVGVGTGVGLPGVPAYKITTEPAGTVILAVNPAVTDTVVRLPC